MASIEPAQRVTAAEFNELRRTYEFGTIVLCKGAYDLTHAGHVESLRAAARFGDTLIVAVATDESVTRRKGPSRPILSWEERSTIVASLKFVDFVTTYDHESPFGALKELEPNVFCASHFSSLSASARAELAERGMRFVTVPRPSFRCTSEILNDIHIGR